MNPDTAMTVVTVETVLKQQLESNTNVAVTSLNIVLTTLSVRESACPACEHGGVCNADTFFSCDCAGTGFTGDTCQRAMICPAPCQNKGVCTNEDLGTCECAGTGFTGNICQTDLDECADENGGCETNCNNIPGSFTCGCDSGYKLNIDGLTCDDVFECDIDNGGCQYICDNSPGSFTCTCDAGYTLKPNKFECEDINECDNVNGGCEATCDNSVGSFSCSCATGYKLQSDGLQCEDEDECLQDNGGCQHTCENSVGSFACKCQSGYTINANAFGCDDVNECAIITSCQQICTNTNGSFACSCNEGYISNGGGVSCQDLNECGTNNGGCDHICTNSVGSFACGCNPGYELKHNSFGCDDVVECDTDNGGCQQICENSPGSFTCTCEAGYFLKHDRLECEDVNECSIITSCQQICTNTNGSFACSCNEGYIANDGGVSCQDMNECGTNNGGCDHICTNSVGSFACGCNPGYELKNNSFGCDDVVECDTDNGGCQQICKNSPGSFTCTCEAGYSLKPDRLECEDVDECTLGAHNCGGICSNTAGSFNCSCGADEKLHTDGVTCNDCTRRCPYQHILDSNCVDCICDYRTYTGVVKSLTPLTGVEVRDQRNATLLYDVTSSTGFFSFNGDCAGVEAMFVKPGYFIRNFTITNTTSYLDISLFRRDDECAECEHGGICSEETLYACNCTGTGYSGDICETDVDECTSGAHNCGGTCTNTAGSFNCSCGADEKLHPDGVSCNDCKRQCDPGSTLDSNCFDCLCQYRIYTGTVRSARDKTPIMGAEIRNIFEATVLYSVTSKNGSFSFPSDCNGANVMVIKPGYTGMNGTLTDTFVEISLARRVPPSVVKHPVSKDIVVGDKLLLCCEANGSPPVERYEWLRDGQIISSTDSNELVILDVDSADAGGYFCRAYSPVGTASSNIAEISINSEPCGGSLVPKNITLPQECWDTHGMEYNQGQCLRRKCNTNTTDETCAYAPTSCCSVIEYEEENLDCGDFTFKVLLVSKCGCAECKLPVVSVQGTVQDTKGSPIQAVAVSLLGKNTTTDNNGYFRLPVPIDAGRVVIKVVDVSGKHHGTTAAISIDGDATELPYITVKMLSANNTVSLQSNQDTSIMLTGSEEEAVTEITIPQGSYYTEDGAPYEGEVTASIASMNPQNSDELLSAPGDFTYIDDEGLEAPLTSYGMFSVQLKDVNGSTLNVANSVEVAIDTALLPDDIVPGDLALWELDPDTGRWVEVGPISTPIVKRRKRQVVRTFLVGNVILTGAFVNIDYKRNVCYLSIRANKGSFVTAIVENPPSIRNDVILSYGFATTRYVYSGRICLFVPCVPGGTLEGYVIATHQDIPMCAAPQSDVGGLSLSTSSRINYTVLTNGNGMRFNFVKSGASRVDDDVGPIYTRFGRYYHRCYTASDAEEHFQFYNGPVPSPYRFKVNEFPVNCNNNAMCRLLSWYPLNDRNVNRVCYMKVKIRMVPFMYYHYGSGFSEYTSIASHQTIRATSFLGNDQSANGTLLGIYEEIAKANDWNAPEGSNCLSNSEPVAGVRKETNSTTPATTVTTTTPVVVDTVISTTQEITTSTPITTTTTPVTTAPPLTTTPALVDTTTYTTQELTTTALPPTTTPSFTQAHTFPPTTAPITTTTHEIVDTVIYTTTPITTTTPEIVDTVIYTTTTPQTIAAPTTTMLLDSTTETTTTKTTTFPTFSYTSSFDSSVCIEYKCSGLLNDKEITIDESLVKLAIPGRTCRITAVSPFLEGVLDPTTQSGHIPDLDGHSFVGDVYGLYMATSENLDESKKMALETCNSGVNGQPSATINNQKGIAVWYDCLDN